MVEFGVRHQLAQDRTLHGADRTPGRVDLGLLVSTIGFSIGLNAELFRGAAAALIVIFGAVLMLPGLQARLAMASGPIANWTDGRFGASFGGGYAGQFWLGVLLGTVWSPCVGPTLGAASLLAAQGRDLPQVALSMLVFGFGAALPLLIIGLLSREAMQRWRKQILALGVHAKAADLIAGIVPAISTQNCALFIGTPAQGRV